MADAVSEQVQWAVIKVIGGLNLNPKPANITPRKQLRLLDGDKEGPWVFVSVNDGDRAEIVGSGSSCGKVLWIVNYTASVALAGRNKGTQGDNSSLRSWGDAIWPAVGDQMSLKVNGGLVNVNSSMPTGKSAFDSGNLDKAVDWIVKSFAVEMLLER